MADPVDVVRDAPPVPLAPVDTNVHIPDSARRAAALAESFYAKPAESTEAPPKSQGEAPLPHPTSVPQVPVQPQAPEQPADWEHRYNSMKGRFDQQNALNSQLAEELRQQQIFNERLRQEMQAKTAEPAQAKQYVSQQEREAYGDEFFDVVAKRVHEVVGEKLAEVDQIKQQNAQLQQQLQRTTNFNLAQRVGAEVPNWREMNNDPGFLQWLSLRDIYSREVRQSLLQNATRRGDAPAIIAFYKGYLAESGQSQPQAAETAPPAPSRQAAVSLDALVAPGAPRPATVRPDLAPNKRTYSRRDIATFYDQKRRGLWAGRDQEWMALERDITLAPNEGRISD